MFTKDKAFYKTFFSMFRTLVFTNVIVLSVNLVDNIMIGSYNETALSGVSAVNQIQFILQQLIIGAGEAVVVLGSQYWGQKRMKPIRQIACTGIYFGVLISLVLFVAACIAPREIVSVFSKNDMIIDEGVKYLKIIKFSYLAFAASSVILAILRTVETLKIGLYVSLLSLVVNCGLNYLLIGGNLGAPELGTTGAAIATLIARLVEFFVLLVFLLKIDKKLAFRLPDLAKLDIGLLRDYLKIAIPTVTVGGFFGTSTALQTVILGHMNDSAIAANSVSSTLYMVLKVAAVGASSTASVIIGKTVGTGDIQKTKEYSKTLQMIFLIIGVLTSASLLALRVPILSLYNITPETKQMASSFILVLCVTCIGTSYEMPTVCGIIRGGGDAKFVLYNDLISIWGIVLPLSYLAAFVFEWAPWIVILCLNSDQIFKCLAIGIKCNRYRWIKTLTKESEDYKGKLILD